MERTLLMAAVMGGNINIFRLLLNKGFDLNQQRKDGNTTLHLASAESKLSSMIGDLLFRDANSQIMNKDGFTAAAIAEKTGFDLARGATAFYQAVRLEHPEIAEFLIEKGAKINDRDNDGRTPLMASLFLNENNLKLVNLLLSNGADKTLQDKKGKKTFEYLFCDASVELKTLIQP